MDEVSQPILPRWVSWVGLILTISGILVATYLTVAHYTTTATLACPETGVINCAKVTTSSYSEIMGVPLAVLGLIFFVVMLPLQLPNSWRSRNRSMIYGRLAFAGSGVLMVFWLVYVELFKLNAICLYCTVVHILAVVIFALTAYATALIADL